MNYERRRRRRVIWIAVMVAAVAAVAATAPVLAGRLDAAPPEPAEPVGAIDAAHVPALLNLPGEPVVLRYDVYCVNESGDCSPAGTVYARAGQSGAFTRFPLNADVSVSQGRLVVELPATITGSPGGFTYYAVLRDALTGATMTLPAGGAAAPTRGLTMASPVTVGLGTHVFDAVRPADARVVSASWGSGAGQVGLEGGPQAAPIGGSSFAVDTGGTVSVLDEANRRLLRFLPGKAPSALPLAIDGTLADLAIGGDGTVYVLESTGPGGKPVLRSFDPAGTPRSAVSLAERTVSAVRLGPGGPLTLEYPSSQWMPAVSGETPLSAAAQADGATSGLPTTAGQVVVRAARGEVRVALADATGVKRSWRILSSTPVGEVQLVQPLDSGRVAVVMRVYTDAQAEFVALVLDGSGAAASFSVPAADWAETAPVSRFRLVGSSLFQLGSTASGLFIDRYDLGVS